MFRQPPVLEHLLPNYPPQNLTESARFPILISRNITSFMFPDKPHKIGREVNRVKKILTPKSSPSQTAVLSSKLRRLILEHHGDIAAFKAVRLEVREAWELSGGRVKLRVELELKDGSYRNFTRIVPFALPPEMKSTYRDWTIVTKPTWYGYRYQLLDETGAAADESETDLIEAKHVEQDARREIDRRIAERVKTKPVAKPLSQAPAAKTVEAELLPSLAASPVAADSPARHRSNPCTRTRKMP
jgi:hypothetical protein